MLIPRRWPIASESSRPATGLSLCAPSRRVVRRERGPRPR
jgi:hypothetical protein